MLSDFNWLAAEAKQIHALFESLFYSIVLTLLLLGIILEYFKFSIGSMPSFATLVGRSFVAAIMLATFPEVLNTIAGMTDAIANEIGGLNKFELVLSRMGEQVDKFSWSWTSIRSMVIVTISFVAFFLLYISVYLTNALYIFSWTILYIFSPLLIAFYVLPVTAKITSNLYRSLFMVASWKVVWCVLAAILWSSALMDLDQLSKEANFLTICIFNIMLAFSLLFTPFVANSFISQGLAGITPKLGTAGVGLIGMGMKHILRFTKQQSSALKGSFSMGRNSSPSKNQYTKNNHRNRSSLRNQRPKNKPTPKPRRS